MEPVRKMCRECGRMIFFLDAPGGVMPCNSLSVEVIPDKYGRMFYMGEGKIIRGRIAKAGESGAVKAWESHYAMCPASRKTFEARRGKKKSDEEIALARKAAEMERERAVERMLESRQKEWAARGF